jgi:RNA polymerase sigma factor (sigma-70 family)
VTDHPGGSEADRCFPLTTANLRAELCDPAPHARRRVMETLARRYWKPVYHFLARSYGKGREESADLTQAFFSWLLERDLLLRFDSSRSSFRTFLKGVLRNFAGNEHQALQRLKRGGGITHVALDLAALDRDRARLGVDADPELLFDRAWLREVVSGAVERVRARYQAGRRIVPFLAFEQRDLCDEAEPPSYAAVAGRLGVKEAEVRRYLSEVRARVRAEVRAELQELEGEDDALVDWRTIFRR